VPQALLSFTFGFADLQPGLAFSLKMRHDAPPKRQIVSEQHSDKTQETIFSTDDGRAITVAAREREQHREVAESSMIRSFIMCALYSILLG
jgi:hypothetical protein